MGDASIPVDIRNPGQVFACLGLLEAADVLVGGAEGGFSEKSGPGPHFELSAQGEDNPVEAVLDFLTKAKVRGLVPRGWHVPRECQASDELLEVEALPASEVDDKTLPVRLRDKEDLDKDGRELDLSCWCDGSGRTPFKLYRGQQRSVQIAREMIEGVKKLVREHRDGLSGVARDPFGVLAPLGGSSFKLDARKGWTAIDAGFSIDDPGYKVKASPVVEILGAIGLEHARPARLGDEVRYSVWFGKLPPALARPALALDKDCLGVRIRRFRAKLEKSGHNDVMTFAEEVP